VNPGYFILILAVTTLPFLLYLWTRDRRDAALEQKRTEAIGRLELASQAFQRELMAKHVEAFSQLGAALNKNSDALIRNSEQLRRIEELSRQQGGK
jgi:uncharacterized protein YukE